MDKDYNYDVIIRKHFTCRSHDMAHMSWLHCRHNVHRRDTSLRICQYICSVCIYYSNLYL